MKTIIKLFLTLKLLILLTACGGSDINKPVAILDITDLGGVALNNNQLSFGAGFILSGIDSIDEGSGIDSYEWTSLDADAGVIGTTPFLQNTPVTTTATSITVNFPDAKLAPGSYQFQLRVQDTAGNFSNPAVVTLIVVDDVAPTVVLNVHDLNGATLNNNQLSFGAGFILSGKFSTDFGGTVDSYEWTSLDAAAGVIGTTPFLQNTPVTTTATSITVNFPDAKLAPGSYRFQLRVQDTAGNFSNPAVVTLIVVDDVAPTAVLDVTDLNGVTLNNNQLSFGAGFILSGKFSADIGSGIDSYEWTSLDAAAGVIGTTPFLQNTPVTTTADTATISFPGAKLAPGSYLFQLRVQDTGGNFSNPAVVTLIVVDDVAPTAVLNVHDGTTGQLLVNNTIGFGQSFILVGKQSVDIGGTIASYEWTSLDAAAGVIGTTPFLQNTPVTTTATSITVNFPDAKLAPGSYQFQLRVQDTAGNFSNPAVVTLIVVDDVAPTAVLNVHDGTTGQLLVNNTIGFGQSFILVGKQSVDIGGTIASYEWTSLDAAAGVIGTTPFLQNTPVTTTADTATISFPGAKLAPGSYLFQLRVQDTGGNFSNPAVVSLTVVDDVAPTAVLTVTDAAGQALPSGNSIGFGQDFILVGDQSSDLGGTIQTYRWTALTSEGGGLTVDTAIETSAPQLTVSASTLAVPLGIQSYQLEVVDDSGNQSLPVSLDVTVVTQSTDVTPPTLASTNIADGATGVPTNNVVSVTFSEPMDSSTITATTFTLLGASPVTGTVGYDNATDTATFTPSNRLDPDISYTATLTTAVSDVAGNGLASVAAWSFTTEAYIYRISLNSEGIEGSGSSESPVASTDGKIVAFESFATNLVNGDINNQRDIFVRDFEAGITTRVSVAADGTTGGDGTSFRASISADGRYVAYESQATNLVTGDTNAAKDIFVYDRINGTNSRVSVGIGAQATGPNLPFLSNAATISGDGRYVAFYSYATNLVSGDTNLVPDIFVYDRNTEATTRVSVASDGTQSNGQSLFCAISADGRYIAFQSSADNLVADDTNGLVDIFVHDRQTGGTTRVNIASNGDQAVGGTSGFPAISADGRYVAFGSAATNLVANDTNATADIFVHDRNTGETSIVSVASDGTQGDQQSYNRVGMSADGRYLAFHSNSTTLAAGALVDKSDIFLHDRNSGVTSLVSIAADGTQSNNNSYDAALSADGRYIVFRSQATTLVVDDSNAAFDVFRALNVSP